MFMLRRYLRSDQGWITFTVAVTTADGSVEAGVRFANGKAHADKHVLAHPEHDRNLRVRIAGYNAYFVTLNRDMQLELIERAAYGL